jgi:penicillin amidase
MRADQAAPLIFAAWADELTRGIVGAKLGEPALAALYGKRHFRSTLEDILERNDANWCGAAGCAAQSTAALGRALDRLQAAYGADVNNWTWGRAHPALSAHKPFGNVPLLARFFDVRVPTGGDTFTVNVGQYWATSDATPFANRQAASLRAVYDMADLGELTLYLPDRAKRPGVFQPLPRHAGRVGRHAIPAPADEPARMGAPAHAAALKRTNLNLVKPEWRRRSAGPSGDAGPWRP